MRSSSTPRRSPPSNGLTVAFIARAAVGPRRACKRPPPSDGGSAPEDCRVPLRRLLLASLLCSAQRTTPLSTHESHRAADEPTVALTVAECKRATPPSSRGGASPRDRRSATEAPQKERPEAPPPHEEAGVARPLLRHLREVIGPCGGHADRGGARGVPGDSFGTSRTHPTPRLDPAPRSPGKGDVPEAGFPRRRRSLQRRRPVARGVRAQAGRVDGIVRPPAARPTSTPRIGDTCVSTEAVRGERSHRNEDVPERRSGRMTLWKTTGQRPGTIASASRVCATLRRSSATALTA